VRAAIAQKERDAKPVALHCPKHFIMGKAHGLGSRFCKANSAVELPARSIIMGNAASPGASSVAIADSATFLSDSTGTPTRHLLATPMSLH
jgi:hypothetical protein